MGQTGRQSLRIAACGIVLSLLTVTVGLSSERDGSDPTVFQYSTWDRAGVPTNPAEVATSTFTKNDESSSFAVHLASATASPSLRRDSTGSPQNASHASTASASPAEFPSAAEPVAQIDDLAAITDAPPGYTAPSPPPPVDMSGLVGRLIFATLLVLAACAASLFAAKRWLVKGSPTGAGSGALRMVDSIALNQRCSLQLVEVDGVKVLVGLDPSGLKMVLPLNGTFENALQQLEDNIASSTPQPATQDASNNTLGGPLSWTETRHKS